MEDETRLLHMPLTLPKADNPPLVQPLYQSVKFTVDKADQFKSPEDIFYYSRVANPTVRHLEETLAAFQGCDEAVAVASGMAAVTTLLLSVLKQGDHLIHFIESYSPARAFVRNFLTKFGISHTYCSLSDLPAIRSAIRPETRLVFFESPANPMTRLAPIAELVALSQQHNFLLALDNTFAGFHNHRDCGVKVFVHSLTKFAGGHGDVMGGAILGPKEVMKEVRHTAIQLGPTLDPHAAFLFSRGLRTYFLRYERSCQNALKVARFLESHPRVKKIFYPGLASHPDHALVHQLRDFGAIIAFHLDGDLSTVFRFIDKLKLFQLAGSLGSTDSLVVPASMFFAGDLTEAERKASEILPSTVRLSIGIEACEDLIADLRQGLETL